MNVFIDNSHIHVFSTYKYTLRRYVFNYVSRSFVESFIILSLFSVQFTGFGISKHFFIKQQYFLSQVNVVQPALLSETACEREANVGVKQLRDYKLAGLSIAYASGKYGTCQQGLPLLNIINCDYLLMSIMLSVELTRIQFDKKNQTNLGLGNQR